MAASQALAANLVNDPLFLGRVNAAMVSTALTVAGEAVGAQDPGTYAARHVLAAAVLNSPPSYLNRFAWVAAVNATVGADVGVPISIASSTAVNPSVVTTSTVHGLATGNWVEISGHLVNTVINGLFQVTVISTTVFNVPVLGNGAGGATGTVTLQPPDVDIASALGNAFSSIAGVGVTT